MALSGVVFFINNSEFFFLFFFFFGNYLIALFGQIFERKLFFAMVPAEEVAPH